MSDCAAHREYLAAIADGETELVPAVTIDHVAACPDCTVEVQAHRVLTSKLRAASVQVGEADPKRLPISLRTGRWASIAAAAAVLAVAVGAAGWSALSQPDPVQAAVTASSRPLQFQSMDSVKVGKWCLNESGHGLPAVQLDGMQVIGARMDRVPSTEIVTVVYTTPTGATVSVSWLEGQAPHGSGVEDRTESGHEVLIVHAPVGTAVVTGSSSAAAWEIAAAIESTQA